MQASLLISMCILSTKFQRFPTLLAQIYGRDGWIMLLLLLLVDMLFAVLIINLLVKFKDKTFFELLKEKLGKAGQVVVCILMTGFFFCKAFLTYKGSHEFFANVLFDKLSWKFFSLLLILLLIIMVFGGLNGIGRSAELYSFVVFGGLIACFALGLFSVNIQNLFPVFQLNFVKGSKDLVKFFPWAGDFFILIIFMGKIKIGEAPRRSMIISYALSCVAVVLEYVLFYGINEHLSVFQSNALSAITQYSLIGLGIGRPDWFFVLFVFVSKLISCGFYCYSFSLCIGTIFGVRKSYLVEIVSISTLYIVDGFVIKNIEAGIGFFQGIACYYMAIVSFALSILLFIISFGAKNKKGGVCTLQKQMEGSRL